MLDEADVALDEARAAGAGVPGVHFDAASTAAVEPLLTGGSRLFFRQLLAADGQTEAAALAAAIVNGAMARLDMVPPAAGLTESMPGLEALRGWRCLAASLREANATSVWQWRERLGHVPAAQLRNLLLQLAPFTLADGCWLQHASSALNSHERVAAPLLRSYIERGRVAQSHADALRAFGLVLPPLGSEAFSRHEEIHDAMYDIAVIGLALSQFPTLLLPEVVGFNAVLAFRGAEPLSGLLTGSVGGLASSLVDDAFAAIELALEAHASTPRLQRGARLAQALLQEREASLAHMVESGWFEPAQRMARLVERKAAVAGAYHARVRLGGESLDCWFERSAGDRHALLDALADSPHVVPGAPDRSPLVAALASARGSMAGVLDPVELQTVRDWVGSLGPGGARSPAATAAPAPPSRAGLGVPKLDGPVLMARLTDDADRRCAALPLRELYLRLLQLERYPELLAQARRFASLWLARAGLGLDKSPEALPFSPYDHQAFRAWLAERHRQQAQSHADGARAPLPTRQALIESCIQLCPMVFIDGAWLQRIGQVSLRGTGVADRLQRIYLDEVGAGDVRENHPNLYRELMVAMGVELPAFGTEAFAQWPGFEDAAFRLPTMWLCLSQFPRQFLPELLGFTLAVELSGVGGSYRTSSDALRRYGFPSTFVDVHNTIDNVASGHTALAFEAIQLHLDQALDSGGLDEVQRRWKRVWTGWRAIVPPAGMVWN